MVIIRGTRKFLTVLRAHGIAEHIVAREHAATADHRLAKTNDRSVLGMMNDFARLADWRRDEITSLDDLIPLSLDLAQTPCGPLYDRHISPDRGLTAAFSE